MLQSLHSGVFRQVPRTNLLGDLLNGGIGDSSRAKGVARQLLLRSHRTGLGPRHSLHPSITSLTPVMSMEYGELLEYGMECLVIRPSGTSRLPPQGVSDPQRCFR